MSSPIINVKLVTGVLAPAVPQKAPGRMAGVGAIIRCSAMLQAPEPGFGLGWICLVYSCFECGWAPKINNKMVTL
jgi:hypothetical protein